MADETTMQFTVAGLQRFTLRIPNQPIYDESGDRLDGLCIDSRRLIFIDHAIAPDQREEVLVHELTHAWGFCVPLPHTEEERCRLNALIVQQMRMDLERQGGIEVLKSLLSSPVSLPYAAMPVRKHGATILPPQDWWECGNCAAKTMCGSIDGEPAEFVESLQQYQMLRWFRCEFCNTLNTWREVATGEGLPMGVLVQVPPPRLLYGEAARAWLADRPQVTA